MRCSKDSGEVQQRLWLSAVKIVVKYSKDCGEVVNNWLVNLRRAITHGQLQAM